MRTASPTRPLWPLYPVPSPAAARSPRRGRRAGARHVPSRPHRGTRCGCRRGSRCATNAQPPRAPQGHRKRRFQSGQPFGRRAPRATRSIPGAATVSAACCASSAATRYAWRRSTNRWARLGRHHATVACDINGHIRGTRPRRSRVSTSRRWSRAVGRGLVVRPPKREHHPTVLRQPEEVQLVQRAPWCQQPRRAG